MEKFTNAKTITVIIFFGLLCTTQAQKSATRGMIILPAPSENLVELLSQGLSVGAIVGSLFFALEQKAAPILVSSALIRDLWELRDVFLDFTTRPDDQLISLGYNRIKAFETEDKRAVFVKYFKQLQTFQDIFEKTDPLLRTREFMKNLYGDFHFYWHKDTFFLAYQLIFNPEEWILKKVTPHVYLLVPKSAYFNDIRLKVLLGAYQPGMSTSPGLTKLELVYGLKLDHLEDISSMDFIKTQYHQQTSRGQLSIEFMHAIRKIFVTRKDYFANTTQRSRELFAEAVWAFYLKAHGATGPTAEGLEWAHKVDEQQIERQMTRWFGSSGSSAIIKMLTNLSISQQQLLTSCLSNDFRKIEALRVGTNARLEKSKRPMDRIKIQIEELEQFKTILKSINSCLITVDEERILSSLMVENIIENTEKQIFFLHNSGSLGAESLNYKKIKTEFNNKLMLILQFLKNLEMKSVSERHGIEYMRSTFGVLSRGQAANILDFFNTTIITNFLFFNTCFWGPAILKKLYLDVNKEIAQKAFSYTIASGAVSESITTNMMPHLQERHFDFEQKLQRLPTSKKYAINFSAFFNNLIQDGPIDFEETIRYVHKFLMPGDSKLRWVENIPLIKFPGLEWFDVIDIPDKIVSIGNVLAATRDPQRPLHLGTFFGGRLIAEGKKVKKIKPLALLLYTPYVPFPLVNASDSKIPILISMIGGDVCHVLKKFNTMRSFDELVGAVHPVTSMATKKLFFIESVEAVNPPPSDKRVKSDNHPSIIHLWPEETGPFTVTNCIFFNNIQDPLSGEERLCGFYCTKGGKYYRSWWNPKEFNPNRFEHFEEFDKPYSKIWLNYVAKEIPSIRPPLRDIVKPIEEFARKHVLMQEEFKQPGAQERWQEALKIKHSAPEKIKHSAPETIEEPAAKFPRTGEKPKIKWGKQEVD